MGDKGEGEIYSKPVPGYGMHMDDARMKPLLEKCAELKMPINIHIAEPYWMYLPADNTNDGLMNAAIWKVNVKPGMLDHAGLIKSLENAVSENPKTLFIHIDGKHPKSYSDVGGFNGTHDSSPRK